MRDLFIVLFVLAVLTGCKKEVETADSQELQVQNDSLVRTILGKWNFKISIAQPAVSTKLSNWKEWRDFVNELMIAPEPSMSHLQHKANSLVETSAKLRENIPELYRHHQTTARISLLETHVQNLNMHIELDPIDQAEVLKLLTNIQKSTNSLLYQFEEFEIKSKIPKEEGESQIFHSTDTLKRATLNALPQE